MEINPYIEKAKKGDQIAFTYLLDHYWNEVYGFMLKRTENETDSEDITIETFSKAFDKLSTYNPEFQFNTWLIAIAKNVHIDFMNAFFNPKSETMRILNFGYLQESRILNV